MYWCYSDSLLFTLLASHSLPVVGIFEFPKHHEVLLCFNHFVMCHFIEVFARIFVFLSKHVVLSQVLLLELVDGENCCLVLGFFS